MKIIFIFWLEREGLIALPPLTPFHQSHQSSLWEWELWIVWLCWAGCGIGQRHSIHQLFILFNQFISLNLLAANKWRNDWWKKRNEEIVDELIWREGAHKLSFHQQSWMKLKSLIGRLSWMKWCLVWWAVCGLVAAARRNAPQREANPNKQTPQFQFNKTIHKERSEDWGRKELMEWRNLWFVNEDSPAWRNQTEREAKAVTAAAVSSSTKTKFSFSRCARWKLVCCWRREGANHSVQSTFNHSTIQSNQKVDLISFMNWFHLLIFTSFNIITVLL